MSTRSSLARNSIASTEGTPAESTASSDLRTVRGGELGGKKAVSTGDETSVAQQRRKSFQIRALSLLAPSLIIQVIYLISLFALTETLTGGPGVYANSTLCRFAATLEAYTLYYVSIPMTKHLVKRHKTGAGTRVPSRSGVVALHGGSSGGDGAQPRSPSSAVPLTGAIS
ncbi:hypothetical protein AMAG_04025 [Allomyces macrogynus ATCC 38327]|uniref:Uncharacterized protein n=1 Tax=Allomyces macrogynus (strain ATCC 38327) TaxID=578462 RepID=A0A0L0S7Z9_ALLM3|nr:hypothetical protein AMAG_04025 [Allomyces macrogynus ATCC 38327]|eukprot:KNE58454.1 hypothetical protein AMAG_04025 [Allomyces macrogynus ATCC 38327]